MFSDCSYPIVDIDGAVTQGINFAGNEVPTIILIQRDFVRVHTIERIHAVEVSRHQLVVFIVAERRLRSQCVNSEFTMENMYWLAIADVIWYCVLLTKEVAKE